MPERIESPTLELFRLEGIEPLGTIGIPVRDTLNTKTATSLITTALRGVYGPSGTNVDFNIVQGSVLPLQRNELVQRMRGDWLMFIDDDMVWQPEQIARLIAERDEYDLDILGGLCFRRTEPHNPTLYMRETPTDGKYIFLEDWEPDTIKEVDATGMAFIIIHKRVFERMVQFYEDKPDWTMPPYEVRAQQHPPNFFRWEGDMGEDIRFCQDAKRAGLRIFVHTGIVIGHAGERIIGPRDYLEQLALREPDVEAARREINDTFALPTLEAAEAKRRLGWLTTP